jgi:hypothetical protein
MELTVTGVDYAPPELDEQVPFKITLLRLLPGPDRPDYWLGEMLTPLFWFSDNRRIQVDHVVVCARHQGTWIAPLVENLAIGIAYVTDPAQVTDASVDFAKCKYVAIGTAHETAGKPAPPEPGKNLAGRIGRTFGLIREPLVARPARPVLIAIVSPLPCKGRG